MQILKIQKSSDYELIDSGEGEKLERFGKVVLRRPDPQALWKRRKSDDEWKNMANGYFTREAEQGKWVIDKSIPDRWEIEFGGLKVWIKPTAFKHTGIFPEQVSNWDWLREVISGATAEAVDTNSAAGDKIEILNLFGYTGGATLAAASAGANVVHVDSSKSAITWARDNAEASGLADKPIRWILDDALVFAKKEVKRGHKYNGIIMDPPAFGHGPNKELWKIEESFLELFETCLELIADKPLFFLINGYSAGYSSIAYDNNLQVLIAKYGGKIESGELMIEESGENPRLLPCGIFTRWRAS